MNESRLISFRNKTRVYPKIANESLLEFKNETKLEKVTVFLSHKHGDKENLDAAISFLKSQNVQVYVDWQDSSMPKYTNGYTAQRIKEQIKDNRKFIFLATEEAIDSRWCNWELGLGDAAKYINHIAILPVKKVSKDFSGTEYLAIYPYIYESDTTPNLYYVKFPNNEIKTLKDWLIY